MSDFTLTKSSIFKEDMGLADGGTGAEEEGTRKTSTGGEISLTRLDASHIKFQTVAKSLEDLVDGGKDVTIKPLNIDAGGTIEAGGTLKATGATTLSNLTPAGYVKNSVAGLLSTGAIAAADLPTGIDAAKIGAGTVSNTEFELLNGVTAIPTAGASRAEQETGTSTTVFVSPGVQKYHPSAAKAWVYVTGAGTPVISAAFNVTSITDSDVGSFIVNFTVPFSSANYAMGGVAHTEAASYVTLISYYSGSPPTTDTCGVVTPDINANLFDVVRWSAVFYGDQ